MSGGWGDGRPPTDLAFLIEHLDKIDRRLDTLERPSGEQLAQAVKELTALVEDIQQTLDDYIANDAYTKAQVDAKVASPGNIAPGSVTASGNITTTGNIDAAGTVSANYGGNFPAGLRSTGAYATNVTGGGAYAAAWIHNDGRIGFAPSSRRFKTGIRLGTFTLADIFKLQGYFFQYRAQVPYSQTAQREHFNLLAEDTHKAGFGFLVDYDANGKPFNIRADMLAAVVLEGMRYFYQEHLDLADRVTALENANR